MSEIVDQIIKETRTLFPHFRSASRSARIVAKYPHICTKEHLYAAFEDNISRCDAEIETLLLNNILISIPATISNSDIEILIPQDTFKSKYGNELTSDEMSYILNKNGEAPSTLVEKGFLTIAETLSLPHLGALLRILHKAINWVLGQIKKRVNSYKSLASLWMKPMKKDTPPLCIFKFRGIGIEWVLHFMIGFGLIEQLYTPVGVIYKSTGKKI